MSDKSFEILVKKDALELALKISSSSAKPSYVGGDQTAFVLFRADDKVPKKLWLLADDHQTRSQVPLMCESVVGTPLFSAECGKLLKVVSTVDEGGIRIKGDDDTWVVRMEDFEGPLPYMDTGKHLMSGVDISLPEVKEGDERVEPFSIGQHTLSPVLTLASKFINTDPKYPMLSVAQLRASTLLAGDPGKWMVYALGEGAPPCKFEAGSLTNILRFLQPQESSDVDLLIHENRGFLRHNDSGSIIQFFLPEQDFPPLGDLLKGFEPDVSMEVDHHALIKSFNRLQVYLSPDRTYLNFALPKGSDVLELSGVNIHNSSINDRFKVDVTKAQESDLSFDLRVQSLKDALKSLPEGAMQLDYYASKQTVQIYSKVEGSPALKIGLVLG